MPKRPPPATTVVDGETMYLLTANVYANLDQNRRQVGSLSTRLGVLRQQGRADAEALTAITALVAGHSVCAPITGCLLCGIRDILDARSSARVRDDTTVT